MNKKIITILAISITAALVIFFMGQNKKIKITNEGLVSEKVSKIKSPSMRSQVKKHTQKKKFKKEDGQAKKIGFSREVLAYIKKNIASEELKLNEEKYKIVQELVAKTNPLNKVPFFTLYNHPIYKSKTNGKSDEKAMGVVINTNTGTLGIITGKLIINLTPDSSSDELVNKYDLTLEYENKSIGMIVVSNNGNLQTIYKLISNDPLVRDIKIEVIESAPIPK